MKPRQLAGVAERKARHAVIPRLPIDFDQRYEEEIPATLPPDTEPIAQNLQTLRTSLSEAEREEYRTLAADALNGRFTFLNRTIEFGDEIDWDHEKLDEFPLLWRLKLQAFEHLEWLVLGYDDPSEVAESVPTFERWLLSWANENPIGAEKYLRRSWIPHSVSLRILNWCRYAAWCEENGIDVSDDLYRAIYKNALFLENHVEWDIGGNHLIENAIALVMAGVLFNKHDTQWVDEGLHVLEHAAETQFLSDGGHFERSPMYHIMVLTRYLTAEDLLKQIGRPVPNLVTTVTRDGTNFLKRLAPPDRRIPLLNDATFGEVLPLEACLKYAQKIGVRQPRDETHNELSASGYYWLGNGQNRMLVDAGPVGPAHLPAHSHNDLLSVLLWIDGTRILTDTGVFDYAPGGKRQYARSISAHNTVQVGDEEPIRVGGSYLMGQRTEPSVEYTNSDTRTQLKGKYTARSVLGSRYTHHRRITKTEDLWSIWDDVFSEKAERRVSRLHLHPKISETETVIDGHSALQLNHETRDLLGYLIPVHSDSVNIEKSRYYPEFGRQQDRTTIEIQTEQNAGTRTGIVITPKRPDSITVEYSGKQPSQVSLEYPAPTDSTKKADSSTALKNTN
ncbi:heparinase II/III family protein [Haloferacaceae archaeon DSL9]